MSISLQPLWTVAYQGPLSMGFPKQEYWSGLLFPSPGDLPNPGIKPGSPTLWADALPSEPPGKPAGLRGIYQIPRGAEEASGPITMKPGHRLLVRVTGMRGSGWGRWRVQIGKKCTVRASHTGQGMTGPSFKRVHQRLQNW